MAKNPFSENSPLALQLKSELPTELRSQLNSLSNIPGNLSGGKGIQSDITGSLDQLTNNTMASLEIATNLSSTLSKSGLSEKIRKGIIAGSVSPSVFNKTNISTAFPGNPIDLTNLNNRLPPSSDNAAQFTPSAIMKRAQERCTGLESSAESTLYFPLNLQDSSEVYTYMHLSFQVYSRTDALTAGMTNPGLQIYLPLPDNYQHTYAVTYEEKNLGLISETEEIVMGRFDEDKSNLQEGFLLRGGQKIAQSLLKSLSGTETVGDLIGANVGEIPNPHPSLFFQGLPLRSFNWNWKLVPRNPDEAEMVRKIIKQIKIAILPKNRGSTLGYPDLVLPGIMRGTKKIEELGTFKKCSCTGLNINYTAEGTSAFFHDGKPVSVNIGMELKEIEMFLSEDVK